MIYEASFMPEIPSWVSCQWEDAWTETSKRIGNDSSAGRQALPTESCKSQSGFQKLELEPASFNRRPQRFGTVTGYKAPPPKSHLDAHSIHLLNISTLQSF